tara:strand:- start:3695 stop:3886 length:192 start_codon:yes stop_codon:yes gene_type:complete
MIKHIVQTLNEYGLSQNEISRRANVPQSRISEILSGKQHTISYEAGKRLEKVALDLKLIEIAA